MRHWLRFSVGEWPETGVDNRVRQPVYQFAGRLGRLDRRNDCLAIVIHLINLMRHKTVKWAAMEFLLQSHKKNRNWVWLKQLLLLLSRIAALILALLMFAQIGCNEDRISRLLGGATTHHYVLLDDSFSMSDRGSGGTAFDQARTTLSLIGSRAKNRQNQLFFIIAFFNGSTILGGTCRVL